MARVIGLNYVAPYCKKCGRQLPKGRTRLCYACKRPYHRTGSKRPAATVDAAYTIADRVAMARSYGLSYGQYMAIISCGGQLPKRIRQTEWPYSSAHLGEK